MTCSFIAAAVLYSTAHTREAANLVTAPSPGNQNITRADCRHGHVTSPHLTAGTQMPSGRCIKQWHLEAFPVPEIGKAQCNLHGLHTQACNCFMPVPMRCEHDWKPPVDATRLTLAGHLGWHRRSRRLFCHVSSGLGPV
ncbi:hypothetical protein H0G86_001801 [Trichoderma simmonsii]|uniref:Uncharacterized protein n=1 Tax=Trichoderma simmonsii TaxID=1491479 RepID=A0A8G0PBI8_9HYPO|nr:hypothetical protein H0G86_001801 [Trichoderma simmonsii]